MRRAIGAAVMPAIAVEDSRPSPVGSNRNAKLPPETWQAAAQISVRASSAESTERAAAATRATLSACASRAATRRCTVRPMRLATATYRTAERSCAGGYSAPPTSSTGSAQKAATPASPIASSRRLPCSASQQIGSSATTPTPADAPPTESRNRARATKKRTMGASRADRGSDAHGNSATSRTTEEFSANAAASSP